MAQAIRMPALGQTTEEIAITGWLKAAGESVRLGELLYTVETDKTTLEVESPFEGTLLRIDHTAPVTVRVGTVIAYIGEIGEVLPASDPAPGQVPSQGTQPTQPAPTAPLHASPQPAPPSGKVLATPAARQLAREYGLDLTTLRGSGPDGRIEKEDVRAALDRM